MALMDTNPLPLFFSGYLILYLIAYSILFRRWPSKLRPEASSCTISLAHGTPAVFLASRAIFAHPAPDFHSPNTPLQGLVLDYSIAYFLMDLVHYLFFHPSDLLFIAHHLATLFVFLTCRYVVRHGAFAILGLLVLAEVTSFCQNVWTLTRARRSDVDFAAKESFSLLFSNITIQPKMFNLLKPYGAGLYFSDLQSVMVSSA